MIEVSFVAAFLGGVLSLLAPCSALLLPVFFAYAFTTRTQLQANTLLFLAGLSTVFVPLGMGASFIAALLIDYRDAIILAAGLMLVVFGLLELTGTGFTFVPQSWAGRFQPGRGAAAVYGTGLVYGVAGFCSGPLLGAVLTVAGSTASPPLGAALLFTYAAGTAVPLFVLAWCWDRYRLGERGWLRGRPITIGPLHTHTMNLAAGVLFIGLGISFIAFQGSSALSGVYDDLGLGALGFRLQLWIADNLVTVPDMVWVVGVLVVVGANFLWRRVGGKSREGANVAASGSGQRG